MKITLLGTGTSQGVPVIGCRCKVCRSDDPKDDRMRCSLLVEEDGVRLVIDTGPDFRMQMLRENVTDIDGILMTHFHNDHLAGLDDIRPFNFQRNSAINVYADELTREAIQKKFGYIFEPNPYPGVPRVNLMDHGFKPFRFGPFEITPFKVFHGALPITAYRINDLVYITDARYFGKEFPVNPAPKALILNALRREEHHSHLSLEQAIEVSKDICADLTYFLHISHYMGLHKEVDKELPAGIHLGYDGLSFEI